MLNEPAEAFFAEAISPSNYFGSVYDQLSFSWYFQQALGGFPFLVKLFMPYISGLRLRLHHILPGEQMTTRVGAPPLFEETYRHVGFVFAFGFHLYGVHLLVFPLSPNCLVSKFKGVNCKELSACRRATLNRRP